MVFVVYGTTGELIKLAPLLVALRGRDAPLVTLCTGQQVEQIPDLLGDLSLPSPDVWLARGRAGRDLERASDIPAWLAAVATSTPQARRMIARSSDGPSVVVVHGDTFTTVAGALIGRIARLPVAHIEAGLRSGDVRNPFPEELDRRAAGRLARIHYAPGAGAVANLRRAHARGEIIDTGANTIVDSLELVPAGDPPVDVPGVPFGLVSIHRFELLGDARALREILEVIGEAAKRRPMLFVEHPVTAAAIERHGLRGCLGANVTAIPRLRYFAFIALLRRSAFLVTDSGGSQEECAWLGHPCLVHRRVTERTEGLGGSVVLSGGDVRVARAFLEDPFRFSAEPQSTAQRPTDVIVRDLERRGFLGAAPSAGAAASAPGEGAPAPDSGRVDTEPRQR